MSCLTARRILLTNVGRNAVPLFEALDSSRVYRQCSPLLGEITVQVKACIGSRIAGGEDLMRSSPYGDLQTYPLLFPTISPTLVTHPSNRVTPLSRVPVFGV